ncbi:phosphate acetyltransferase [Niabella ginsenosidivorans]|uniref:Phosphate acetyltransferase n=1 Tax=Niabella ginsenosidivorans TaxID=1176587 RepID=A0A1A9I2W5_9BACT|nr:phosphate acetyltransferase [Niabella ginsenosidivorans]ANH81399.1 phosphate acetyltransferase [Niabella ginsenosidivorans]
MNRSVYIISPSAQSGKLMISLGVMQMLQRTTTKVAYLKPLIESKDLKDNHIDTLLTHFKINMKYEDAYVFTRAELSELENQGKINEVYEQIINRYKDLESRFDFVLVEGSDFNEEGSVFEVDFNASLAQTLAMPVLLVDKDGFDTTSELVNNVVAEVHSFLARDINVIGLFVSRCTKNRVEVQQMIEQKLRNKIVVSVIPYLEELTKPSMQEIAAHLKAHILFGADKLETIAKTSIIGGMQLGNYLARMPEDCVCVIPGDRGDLVVGTMLANMSPHYPNVAGIVLSGGLLPERSIVNLIDGSQKPLPVLAVSTGTFETANKVANIKSRIYPANQYKLKLSLDLFEGAVDTGALNEKINSVKTEGITPRMFQYNMLVTAKKLQRHIVLPESTDDRILTAASYLAKDKIVFLTLLGNVNTVKARVAQLSLYWDDERIRIIDPELSDQYEAYYHTLYELRKSKGLELAAAADLMLDASYFGTMMVYKGEADGMVSGAVNTTAHTIKPALQFVKTRPGFKTVSSIFFMLLHDRVLVYGDCAIVPNPTAAQLAEIAISSADSAKAFGIETPKIAMLSYSSGSSGTGEGVEKVRMATAIVKEKRPDLLVEGPIQYDAAVDPVVGKSKLPDSPVAGQANVLIFPDLNTGNNTYKAVQRETGALAVGPVLQGLNKPINDLSRGATIEDIYNTVVITAIQSANN